MRISKTKISRAVSGPLSLPIQDKVAREQVDLSFLGINRYELWIAREDLLHPVISGNKFRKLKYNLERARKEKLMTLLTFGGAFSNHVLATAYAGKHWGFKTVGIIRGEELVDIWKTNPTLKQAVEFGMTLRFISREQFRRKEEKGYLSQLKPELGSFYLLPEGGTNEAAVQGCEEILLGEDNMFEYICTPVGTGGTVAGLVRSAAPGQKVVGYSVLQGDFQEKEIRKYVSCKNLTLADAYCFGGYAKIDASLVRFINRFKKNTGIALDPVYTGKMMFGIIEMIRNGFFKENSRILAIHTGGLQGIAGMNKMLKRKNLPLLHE